MTATHETGTINELCNVEYGTRVVRKRDAGSTYPVYGGGGETFYLDTFNRENRVVIARFAMSEKCTRKVLGKFALNDSGLTLSPKNTESLRQDYLDYWTLSLNDVIYEKARGTAQKNLDMSAFREIELSFPRSIEKQKLVVEILDKAFAEIDSLEENLQLKEEKTRELFQSSRDEILKKYTKNISEIDFGDVGTFVRGPFGGSLTKSIFKKSGFAIFEQKHAIHENFDSFRYFVDQKKFDEMRRFEVIENDLIMSCSGTYGKISIVPKGSPRGIINQALLKITPNKGVESVFLKHWMKSGLFQIELAKQVGGAALQNVPSVAKMKAIKIRLPKHDEQLIILQKLNELEVLNNELNIDHTNKIIKTESLRKSILSKAFKFEEKAA